MQIKQVTEIDNKVVEAFERLVPQLTGIRKTPSAKDLETILNDNLTYLFVAIDNGEIVGSTTLVLYRIPTSLKGMIEDVIVDDRARGKGVATLLMNVAIDTARKKGASKVELTSNPTRIAANKMYQKMGFELRETNFYRLDL